MIQFLAHKCFNENMHLPKSGSNILTKRFHSKNSRLVKKASGWCARPFPSVGWLWENMATIAPETSKVSKFHRHEHVMHFLAKFGVCRVSKQFVCTVVFITKLLFQTRELAYSTNLTLQTILANFPQRSSWGNQVKWLIERKLNVQKDRDHRTHHRAQWDQPEMTWHPDEHGESVCLILKGDPP